MKKAFFSLLLLTLSIAGFAQHNHRNCGTMENHQQLLLENPDLHYNQSIIERQVHEYIQHNMQVTDRNIITIPVVVHVVYRTSAQNISDAQILSQINILNQDFRKLNADAAFTPSVFAGSVADIQVEFCLATVDPSGNPTNGITRTSTTKTSFSSNNDIKYTSKGGKDAWNRDSYLNVWVGNLGNGLLGYAQFPGGPAATDGVVCTYTAFGNTGTAAAPFNKGRTATHEVGHWLNLRHIWGDDNGACTGSDYVEDTPNSGGPYYGCPGFPQTSCSTSDLFMNYMDYTDDACMYMFTTGQKNRMRALFATGGARAALLNSNGCGTTTPPATCETASGLAATNITDASATLNWNSVSGAGSYNVRLKQSTATTWSTGSTTATSINATGLTACTGYDFEVQAVCSGSTGSWAAATFTSTGCGITYCSSNGNNSSYEWIQSVTVGGLTNNSGNNGGYGNFLNLSTDLNIGNSYNVSLSPGFGSSTYNEYWKIWIDFNGNGSFDDAGELVFAAGLSSTTVSGSITIPSGVATGATRIRVSMKYNAQQISCESFAYGEVEDYTVTITNVVTEPPAPVCAADAYEPNETQTAAKAISINQSIQALICESGDEDWFSFSNANKQKNLKVTLTNLPADYDLELYNSSGVRVAFSNKAGTASETIIYNNAPVGTYFARVFGYNGAMDYTGYYTLTPTRSNKAYTSRESGRESGGDKTPMLVTDGFTMNLYPNPSAGRVNLSVVSAEPGSGRVTVTDVLGRVILQQHVQLNYGENVIEIPGEELSNGTYVVQLEHAAQVQRQKIMISK